MAAIIVVLVVLAVTGAFRARRRRPDGAAAPDIPTVAVGWAAGMMPVGREQWGQAMVGELGQYAGFARWRFALGCAVAALGVPRHTGERWVVGSVLAASIASAGLVGYGTVRYPGMVTGTGTWLEVAAFGAVLVGFVVVTAIAVRPSPIGVSGVVYGCALAGVWIVVGRAAVSARSAASMLLLMILPVVSIAAGVLGARRARTRAAGRRTVVVSAVVAALVVFIVLTADTLITGGRPYDAGQLQDFAASGYPDMATYAVSDDLGTAMVLLLLMSTMTATLGTAAATLAIRHRR
jgi:hypothetical protein